MRRGANAFPCILLIVAASFANPAPASCAPRAGPAPLDAAVVGFKAQVKEWIDESLGQAELMREFLAAGDLAGAERAWLAARGGWERAEVVTDEFFPDLDAAIDAWPNGKAGFHVIEAKLFGAHRMDALPETDALIANMSEFQRVFSQKTLTAQGVLNGIAKLAFEVGENKANGGESPFSGNSIAEMGDNIAGIDAAYRAIFANAVGTGDARLDGTIGCAIGRLQKLLSTADVKTLDQDELREDAEDLVVSFGDMAAVIGLAEPRLGN